MYDKERDVNVLKGVSGNFYQEDGSSIAIKSDAGEVDMKTRNIVLSGNAKGVFSSGGELVGDKISWSSKDQLITAEGKVRINKDDIVATAKKAIVDTVKEHLQLEGDALVQKGAL